MGKLNPVVQQDEMPNLHSKKDMRCTTCRATSLLLLSHGHVHGFLPNTLQIKRSELAAAAVRQTCSSMTAASECSLDASRISVSRRALIGSSGSLAAVALLLVEPCMANDPQWKPTGSPTSAKSWYPLLKQCYAGAVPCGQICSLPCHEPRTRLRTSPTYCSLRVVSGDV